MILSRELGKRIWGGSTSIDNGGGGVSSDYIAGLLAGYATESWVDEHYISIDFFSRLFQAHGTENGSEIDVMPNDMETTITSVESMFGFWTNLYISALGSNGAAPAGISLGMLTDVTISGTPSAGQVLTFDAVTQKWVNGNAQAGATALANLTDVTLTSLQANQVLVYNGNTWINSSVKTINGYSIFGTGDIPASGGGTGNYLPLAGGTMTGPIRFSMAAQRVLIYDIGSYPSFRLGSASDYGGGILQLYDNNDEKIRLFANSSPDFPSWIDVGSLGIGTHYPGGYKLYVNGQGFFNEKLVINGKLGVGTSGVNGGVDIWSGDLNVYVNGLMVEGNAAFGTVINPGYKLYINGKSFFNSDLIINGKLGVGTSSPQYPLEVIGTIYATGAITALSDARKKDITGEAGITVEQIAHAPAVQFLWKDKERRKDGQQVGTLAQYWRTVLPEVVMDKGGELSMQYGVAALVSSIIIARKVANHEVRIDKMEKWMKKWAEENDE